jgi:putative FmdB family regulatory protein
MDKKVLILGNSKGRINHSNFINNWKSEIWGCNGIYKESLNLDITSIGAVDDKHGNFSIIEEIIDWKRYYNLSYRILYKNLYSYDVETFTEYLGLDSGNEMIHQAILENYTEIYLAGFSFIDGNEDEIYYNEKLYVGNFINSFERLKREFPNANIKFAPFDKDTGEIVMPCYDYYCQNCQRTYPIFCKVEDRNSQTCPECHGKVIKKISNISIPTLGNNSDKTKDFTSDVLKSTGLEGKV